MRFETTISYNKKTAEDCYTMKKMSFVQQKSSLDREMNNASEIILWES